MATGEAASATMAKFQATGGMKEINQAFKAARLDNQSLRYSDYLQGRKANNAEGDCKASMRGAHMPPAFT